MEEPGDLPGRFVNGQTACQKLVVWVAQGFGVGWIPLAPGTFGSVLGFGWLALLLAGHSLLLLLLGSLALAAVAVWACGVAEKILGRKDPGSVVLDEIAAIPVCLWAWAAVYVANHHSLPSVGDFFSPSNWPLLVCVFAGFRVFDVLKPWPIGASQRLPGGWGIVIDDLLAAAYVNAVVLVLLATKTI
jgi:phosphatidylglycerophosphatase A